MSLLEQLTELAIKYQGDICDNCDLVSYAFVKDDTVLMCENRACYYQLEHGVPWKSGITGIISNLGKAFNRHKKEVVEAWLDFHVTDEVFGKAILSKDISWMLENKMVISDTTAPGNVMQGVLVSIRQLWEYDQIVKTYYELRKANINKVLAYNLAHFLYIKDGNYTWSIYNPGHSLFSGTDLSVKHLSNWLKGKLKNDKYTRYIDKSAYAGTAAMFDGYEGDLRDRFKFWIKKIMQPKATTSKSTNPFGKAKVEVGNTSWPCDELNAAIKANEETFIKELLA